MDKIKLLAAWSIDMNVLTKPLSVLVQLLLVLCFTVSSGEAAIWTLQDTVNDGTSVKVDDAPPAPTDPDSFPGLNSFSVDGVERVFQQWFWFRVGS
ncbi:MAG: hypothetical protein H7Y05_06780, partial [Steroidobacteraceae bacterium]|nr:hypothetical protein [Deltaproteobacteria bacterium]